MFSSSVLGFMEAISIITFPDTCRARLVNGGALRIPQPHADSLTSFFGLDELYPSVFKGAAGGGQVVAPRFSLIVFEIGNSG
jgi:hypothetical protein